MEKEISSEITCQYLTIDEYQRDAVRTLKNSDSVKFNLLHMAAGLITEYGELAVAIHNRDTVNTYEEVADLLWYVSNICTIQELDLHTFLDIPFVATPNIGVPMNTIVDDVLAKLLHALIEIIDILKKYCAYNNVAKLSGLNRYLLEIGMHCKEILEYTRAGSLEHALTVNILKLRARYPEKFTEDSAINRNIAKELEVLKQ